MKRMATALVIAVVVLLGSNRWLIGTQQFQATARAQRQGQPPAGAPAPGNFSSVTKEQYEQWMKQYSNSGRWGKDDQKGALNLITAEKRKQAAALVKSGITVSLAHDIERDNGKNPKPAGGWMENKFIAIPEYVMENLQMEFHGSRLSHFDALCHRMTPGQIYNGFDMNDVVTVEGGCSKMAVTMAKDGVVTRGVLVDIPGTTRLTLDDILAWEKRTGLKVSSGDALLLRTLRPGTPRQGVMGYDPSILPFLRQRDVALIGSDVAQDGGNIEGIRQPIHAFVLLALGMNILDNLALDELGDTASRLKRWDFMLVVAPLRVQHGSGSPVNPVALF
jgi:hypothetical protein